LSTATQLKDMSDLRARRREARRRRQHFRLDIALGLLIAIVALLLGPGLAPVAIVALLVVAVCVLSVPFGRWLSRRRRP
jgi:Flp pilus assembly protein TadB